MVIIGLPLMKVCPELGQDAGVGAGAVGWHHHD